MSGVYPFTENGQGPKVLDALRDAIQKYVILPSAHHLVAVVLWIAATHFVDAFDYATRLVARSAEKRSGKTRLLEIVEATCHNPLSTVDATVAAIFRSIEGDTPPTLILDEGDALFGSRKVAENNEDLRKLINAGFQRGKSAIRTVGTNHEPKEFPTFAMVALAGIGAMPDTIEDRAVVVKMRRRKPSEKVQPYRLRRDAPQLHELRDQLASWAASNINMLEGCYPELPVEDRAADVWEPLVMVADLAGGDWPSLARNAAVALTDEAVSDSEDDSINMKLLADIKTIFSGEDTDPKGPRVEFISSALLCDRLKALEDSPWSDWEMNPHKLGYRLREYEVRPRHSTDKKARGYHAEDLFDTFERYLRPKPSGSVQGAESRGKVPDTSKSPDTSEPSGQNEPSATLPLDSNEIRLRTLADTSHGDEVTQ